MPSNLPPKVPAVNAISLARWQEAQKAEALYWQTEAKRPEKLFKDIRDGWHWTAGALDIREETVGARSILDVAGGDFPLVEVLQWRRGNYTVVDPLVRRATDFWRVVQEMAETYRGEPVDEVWGYNVLQHVMDPAAVMATARHHAQRTIRWFDVIESPVYPVHPHSITADWLRAELSQGFRITRDIEGTRFVDNHRQKFVALVAERITPKG